MFSSLTFKTLFLDIIQHNNRNHMRTESQTYFSCLQISRTRDRKENKTEITVGESLVEGRGCYYSLMGSVSFYLSDPGYLIKRCTKYYRK